jgi:hypothetical protein
MLSQAMVVQFSPSYIERSCLKKTIARCWWLMSLILAIWEAEIRRITNQGQSRKIVCKTPSPK